MKKRDLATVADVGPDAAPTGFARREITVVGAAIDLAGRWVSRIGALLRRATRLILGGN